MKFLVIGFTQWDQQNIEQFITNELSSNHCYESVPRQITDNLELIFPKTSAKETQSDFCIIDLDGIGDYQIPELLDLLSNRPALFVRQQANPSLEIAIKNSTQAKIDFIDSNFTQDMLLSILFKAIRLNNTREKQSIYTSTQLGDNIALSVESKANQEKGSIYGSKQISSVYTQAQKNHQQKEEKQSIYDTKQTLAGAAATITHHVVQQKEKESIYTTNTGENLHPHSEESILLIESLRKTKDLISKVWHDFSQYEIYAILFDAFAQKKPCKVMIGNHEFLVYAQNNEILADDFMNFLAYIEQLDQTQRYHLHVHIRSMQDDYQGLKEIYLKNDYKKYDLNLFLWQFYHVFLVENLNFKNYTLRLKLKELPHFLGMKKVPAYMYNVSAVCAQKSYDIAELHRNPRFSFLKLAHLQRIYLLAILSHYADIDIMLNTLQSKS